MELNGSVAIVTGAARGIGRATSVALAEAGARGVVLADVKQSELGETARLVTAAGAEAVPHRTDVGDLASLRALNPGAGPGGLPPGLITPTAERRS